MSASHILLVSLPRSGSTYLSNLLDSRKDVLCFPECFFPFLVDSINIREYSNKKHIASLFLSSCTDGFPLSLEEISDCVDVMPEKTLDKISRAFAQHCGRNYDELNVILWKSTRMVGSYGTWQRIGGRFIILGRPALNVFESQFRVHFGLKNRNPFRFALFEASYLIAFRNYPDESTFRIEYADIPRRFDALVSWLGSAGLVRNDSKAGSLKSTSSKQYWHANIDKPFENKDEQKINNLASSQIICYQLGKWGVSLFPILISAARKAADRRQMRAIRNKAAELLASAEENS